MKFKALARNAGALAVKRLVERLPILKPRLSNSQNGRHLVCFPHTSITALLFVSYMNMVPS